MILQERRGFSAYLTGDLDSFLILSGFGVLRQPIGDEGLDIDFGGSAMLPS